jgi:hypothetical protein
MASAAAAAAAAAKAAHCHTCFGSGASERASARLLVFLFHTNQANMSLVQSVYSSNTMCSLQCDRFVGRLT